MSIDNHKLTTEHRDFWNNLQTDMLTSNINLSEEDSMAIIERSFVFSQFFRVCTTTELVGYQDKLGLKNYGYVILLELTEQFRTNDTNLNLDQFRLHQSIKKVLYDKNCAIGPMLTSRIIIVISEDKVLTEADHREESLRICNDLTQSIEGQFQLKITAGIGSMHSLYAIYPSLNDAIFCLYYNTDASYIYHLDCKRFESNSDFDYTATKNHMLDSVRLRKTDAYDYFGLLMDWIRPFNPGTKRSKILELLVLTYHAVNLDNQSDIKSFDCAGIVLEMMKCSDDQLIEYGIQLFLYISRSVRQQNTIDYSNHIVKATKEYMESHYTDDISLEDMAEHVNISPQYFSKLIKKNTGFNFIDWLSMLRVKKAKELLTNSDYTVKEVCFMVGYKDPNYFSRIFKKRIGITPSEFVKANSLLNNKN